MTVWRKKHSNSVINLVEGQQNHGTRAVRGTRGVSLLTYTHILVKEDDCLRRLWEKDEFYHLKKVIKEESNETDGRLRIDFSFSLREYCKIL